MSVFWHFNFDGIIGAWCNASPASCTIFNRDARESWFAECWRKFDCPIVARIFTALAHDPLVDQTTLINLSNYKPRANARITKNGLRACLDTSFAKCALITIEANFGKAAAPFDNDLSFASLNTFVAAAAKICKFNIFFHPRWSIDMCRAPVKQIPAT